MSAGSSCSGKYPDGAVATRICVPSSRWMDRYENDLVRPRASIVIAMTDDGVGSSDLGRHREKGTYPGTGREVMPQRVASEGTHETPRLKLLADGQPSGPHSVAAQLRPADESTNGVNLAPSAVSWAPSATLTARQWMEYGQRLRRLGMGANWWVGDWIRYGNARYGERYKLATKLTGYDKQTLMNFAYVSSRFAVSRRSVEVSWSHHAELAALDPDAQLRWLARVVVDRLSLRDLRRELRTERKNVPRHPTSRSASEPYREPESPATCPTCGRPLYRNSSHPTGLVDAREKHRQTRAQRGLL